MNRFSLIMSAIFGAIILSSCVSFSENVGLACCGDDVDPWGQGGTDVIEIPATDKKAQLMVREFLKTNSGETPFYKYYSYLIFTEKSSDNYDKRLAASKAFMCEFSDTSKAINMGLTHDDLVVFYAPVNPSANIEKLKISTSAEELLHVYNYDYSHALANKIYGIKPNANLRIAIVSYPLSLGFTEGNINHLSEGALNILDLSGTPPAQIRKTIEKFRKSVTGSYEVNKIQVTTKIDPITGAIVESKIMNIPILNPISKIHFAEKMRIVFASLGSFAEAFAPAVHASELLCN